MSVARARPLLCSLLVAGAAAVAGCGSGAEDTSAPSPAEPTGRVIFRGDFESGNLGGWRLNDGDGLQLGGGPERLQVVTAPRRQGRYAGRFEVRAGDVWKSAPGERTQACYDEFASEGQERSYRWSTRFTEDYPLDDRGFQLWTQWHAKLTGPSQAPIQFMARGDEIGMDVVASNERAQPTERRSVWRGPMRRGQWQDFDLRVGWSSDPARGYVEVRVDGQVVAARTPLATLIPGYPNYVCQGLYRSDDIGATAVLYHDGLTIRQTTG